MQMVGLDEQVMDQILKHVSISLCPNTPGQVGIFIYTYMYIHRVCLTCQKSS